MPLKKKQDEESICHCAGQDKFFSIPKLKHIITTDPRILQDKFPILYSLGSKGAKYRFQTRLISHAEIYNAIEQFRRRLENRYGRDGNELLSWGHMLKTLLTP